MDDLCQGRIIWIEVADPRGKNAYARPVVILTPTAEIDSSTTLFGVVASNTAFYKEPRPDSYIEIPYHPQGMVRTRLRKPTVAICEWIAKIDKSRAEAAEAGGIVPPRVLKAIIDKVREIYEPGPPS
jgi:hypothetical protein